MSVNVQVASDDFVPVIRIYGSTDRGQRAVVNIHGVSPYLYFRPSNVNDTSFDSIEKVNGYLLSFHRKLEDEFEQRRIKQSIANNSNNRPNRRRHIHRLEAVSKLSLYGYWSESKHFIKVYLRNPMDVKQLVSFLESGCLGAVMQPYEAHIPYLLQFTSDNNIQPMNWLYIGPDLKFRLPLPKDDQIFPPPENASESNKPLNVSSPLESSGLYTQSTVPENYRWSTEKDTNQLIEGHASDRKEENSSNHFSEDSTNFLPSYPQTKQLQIGMEGKMSTALPFLKRSSVSDIEIDTHVANLMNRSLPRREFGAELWDEEAQRRKRRGMESLTTSIPTKQSSDAIGYQYQHHQQMTFTDFQYRYDNLKQKGKVFHETKSERAIRRLQSISQGITNIGPSPSNRLDVLPMPWMESNFSKNAPSISPTSSSDFSQILNAQPSESASSSPSKAFPVYRDDSHALVNTWLNAVDREEEQNLCEGLALTQRFQSDEIHSQLLQIDAEDNPGVVDHESSDSDSDEETVSGSESNIHQLAVQRQNTTLNNNSILERSHVNIHKSNHNPDSRVVIRSNQHIIQDIEDILASTQSNHNDQVDSRQHSSYNDNRPYIVSVYDTKDDMSGDIPASNVSEPKTSQSIPYKENQRLQRASENTPQYDPMARRSTSDAKRKLKLANVFDKKRRKVLFVDSSDVAVQPMQQQLSVQDRQSPSIVSSTSVPDLLPLGNDDNPDSFTPPLSQLINLHPTQESPVFVHNRESSHLNLLFCDRPPQSKSLKPLSYYNQLETIHIPVHMSVARDYADHVAHLSSNNNGQTAQYSTLHRRKLMVKDMKAIPEFDGGYIGEENIERAEDRREDRLARIYADEGSGTVVKDALITQDSVEDEGPVEIRDDPSSCKDLDVHQPRKYSNIDPIAERYLRLRFDQALLSIRTILSIANDQPHISYEVMPTRRLLIPTFRPPSSALFRSSSTLTEGGNEVKGDFRRSLLTRLKTLEKKSQIATPTPTNTHSSMLLEMKVSHDKDTAEGRKKSRLTIMSMELFCITRKHLNPNPKHDSIHVLSWWVDDIMSSAESEDKRRIHGILYVPKKLDVNYDDKIGDVENNAYPIEPQTVEESSTSFHKPSSKEMAFIKSNGLSSSTILEIVNNERELLCRFLSIVRIVNPDLMIGYEIQNQSWGYLIQRAKRYDMNMLQLLSRMPEEEPSNRNDYDEYSQEHESGIFITGRILFNMWRRMKSELKLMSYTLHSVANHLLKCVVPYYSFQQLSRWFSHPLQQSRVIQYCHLLSELNLLFLDKLDLIYRLSECSRLYGIDLFSVVSRGSQYRVEAALIIEAHKHNYIAISPSRRQVANQSPMSVIPLVMEPDSKFYPDPIIVLDFQSLYPSMIIAYNLCFSTCLGQLNSGREVDQSLSDTRNRLGFIAYPEKLTADGIYVQSSHGEKPLIAPNGAVFCSKHTREGILPRILREILKTRVMIKTSMKGYSSDEDRVLRRVLDARQLAIKLLANVTYGYAAAGFSGRMPMAELADAIVQSGRSTLEWTIKEIESNVAWDARVVYGDTDSVFVSLRGRTKEQAFVIGREIAHQITSLCPRDVILKFEKVYVGSVLVTKKRYVGWSYETEDQERPHLDAKGIECIRRDQCPLTMKIQEKSLRLLFETKDLSQVKAYLIEQWNKILQGGDKLPLQDFIFRKEVKYGKYNPSCLPPGAIVVNKALVTDEMAVPPYRWKVPYIVVAGLPKALLSELVVTPYELLSRGSTLRVNSTYYIEKCVNPALVRLLSLCGADIVQWYKSIPKPKIRRRYLNYDNLPFQPVIEPGHIHHTSIIQFSTMKMKQSSMDSFTYQNHCVVCDSPNAIPRKGLCTSCAMNKQQSFAHIYHRLNLSIDLEQNLHRVCQQCMRSKSRSDMYERGALIGKDVCQSLDCKIFFERCRNILRIEDYQMIADDF